ncbi:MAG TPA: hypothetical protein VGR38_12090, partial [Candidatus Polarisedimenticolia bacterium]|nr:hypothetical protein [Candidatus Polarisedimenticolia bacterium]
MPRPPDSHPLTDRDASEGLRSFTGVRNWLLAIALVQVAYQGFLLLKGFEFVLSRLPIDDTYYYLQVAW